MRFATSRPGQLRGLLFLALLVVSGVGWAAPVVQVASAPGGPPVYGFRPNYGMYLGAANGLGAGPAAAGVALLRGGAGGGVLYTAPVSLQVSGFSGRTVVSAYASRNFGNPAVLVGQICPTGLGCSASANFAPISTNPAAPSLFTSASLPNNVPIVGGIGIFVSNRNGLGSYTGFDFAVITIVARDDLGNIDTIILGLGVQVQNAVRLVLSSSAGGLPITPGTDFAVDFGTVNALGVSPSPGETVVARPGGVIYSTPYAIQPSFAGFISTTGSISAYVNLDFVNPLILQLQDSPAPGGPYVPYSKTPATPTPITGAAASGATLTRYLGLFVSNVNGPTAFTGADNATATYTLTVP